MTDISYTVMSFFDNRAMVVPSPDRASIRNLLREYGEVDEHTSNSKLHVLTLPYTEPVDIEQAIEDASQVTDRVAQQYPLLDLHLPHYVSPGLGTFVVYGSNRNFENFDEALQWGGLEDWASRYGTGVLTATFAARDALGYVFENGFGPEIHRGLMLHKHVKGRDLLVYSVVPFLAPEHLEDFQQGIDKIQKGYRPSAFQGLSGRRYAFLTP